MTKVSVIKWFNERKDSHITLVLGSEGHQPEVSKKSSERLQEFQQGEGRLVQCDVNTIRRPRSKLSASGGSHLMPSRMNFIV